MEKKDAQNNGATVRNLFPVYDLICSLVDNTKWEYKECMLRYKEHIEAQYPDIKRFRDDLNNLLNNNDRNS